MDATAANTGATTASVLLETTTDLAMDSTVEEVAVVVMAGAEGMVMKAGDAVMAETAVGLGMVEGGTVDLGVEGVTMVEGATMVGTGGNGMGTMGRVILMASRMAAGAPVLVIPSKARTVEGVDSLAVRMAEGVEMVALMAVLGNLVAMEEAKAIEGAKG